MKKRIFSLLLMVAVAVVNFSFNVSAAKIDEKVDREIVMLLGIMEEREATQEVTRAELAKYAIRLINAKINDEPTTSKFTDVKDEDASYINAAYEYGLMNGVSEDKFNPDAVCTRIEMCTVLLRAANYGKYTDAQGGYFTGYSKTATELGLIVGNGDAKVTVKDAEEMLRRILCVEMAEVTTQNGVAMINPESGETILERYFNIRKVEGRVVAVGDLSIGGYIPGGKNTVSILDKEEAYTFEGKIDASYLGFRVEAYVLTENDTESIFYIIKQQDSANEINLKSGDVAAVDKGLTEITYYVSEVRQKKLKLSEETIYVYNGEETYGITPEDLKLKNGHMMLVDHNLDNVYDLVSIWCYDAYIVEVANSITQSIIDSVTKQKIDISLESEDYEVTIERNGRSVDFSAVREWDLVLVADSKGEDGIIERTVVVNNEIVKGDITGIKGNIIEVDNVPFEFIEGFDISELKVGEAYSFGLNLNNQICIVDKERFAGLYYAYLYKLYTDDSGEGDIYADVFTEDGELRTLTFAEKFTLNGARSDWKGLQSTLCTEGYLNDQLVMMDVNADGTIKKLYSAGDEVPPSDDYPEGLYLNIATNSLYYKKAPGSLAGQYILGANTPIFEICPDSSGRLGEHSRVITRNQITLADMAMPDIKIYNAPTSRVADVAVIMNPGNYSPLGDGDFARQAAIVDSVHTCIDEKDEEAWVLKCIHLSKEREYIVDGSVGQDVMNTIKRGDAVYLTFDRNYKVYEIEQVFALNTNSVFKNAFFADKEYTTAAMAGNVNSTRSYLIGEFIAKTKVDNQWAITVACEGTDDVFVYLTDNNSRIVDGTNEKGIPTVASVADIDVGSKVFIATRYAVLRDLFAYSNN